MTNLLTTEDSKRVADALIEAIRNADLDIGYEVRLAINEFLIPERNKWHEDWFPLMVEEMFSKMNGDFAEAAAYVARHLGDKDVNFN